MSASQGTVGRDAPEGGWPVLVSAHGALVTNETEDPAIVPADYMNAVAAAATVVHDGCLGEIIDTMLPFASKPDFFVTDPITAAGPAHDWLVANNPGQVVSESPLLLVQGDADPIVVPARTDALFAQLCSIGQVVEYVVLPGADHSAESVRPRQLVEARLTAHWRRADDSGRNRGRRRGDPVHGVPTARAVRT